MNIRSLSHIVTPVTSSIKEASNTIKSHDTTERDADGREPQKGPPRELTEDEIEKVLKNLREHPGIMANNLSVELIHENEIRLIVIKTADDQIVRRVPQSEFYQLLETLDQKNGRLFSKTA
ncbi:MAG: hypothetical protein H6623_04435 [Bdellovibrionaceae bacterium]|nr:hypothetical protein [Pseudobdellovibrionaceae bacterium]